MRYLVASFCGLILLGVFVVAAASKLADLPGTHRAVEEFGAPTWLAGPFGVALPFLELGIAVLLLFSATALAGAVGALALLATFSLAIGVNLARGRAPDCHCFGQVRSTPIGWATLARNGALMVVAGVGAAAMAAEPDASAIAWLGRIDSTTTAMVAAAAGDGGRCARGHDRAAGAAGARAAAAPDRSARSGAYSGRHRDPAARGSRRSAGGVEGTAFPPDGR